jgi:serine/threonine kinase 32
LTNAIIHEEIPTDPLQKHSDELRDLILQFLVRDVTKRLGVNETGGLDTIKSHPLFKDLDWEKVATKTATPPFIPDVTDY